MRFGIGGGLLLGLLWSGATFAGEQPVPLPEPSLANSVADSAVEGALLARLNDWVVTAMAVEPATQIMTVVASAERYRQALAVGGRRNRETRFIQLPGTMIFDTDEIDAENPVIQSQIVHALVHYYQLLNRRTYACVEAQEFEAFTLQNRWLEDQGERGYISPLTLARWEHCPEPEPVAVAAEEATSASLAADVVTAPDEPVEGVLREE